jgi:hypothetical protein
LIAANTAMIRAAAATIRNNRLETFRFFIGRAGSGTDRKKFAPWARPS